MSSQEDFVICVPEKSAGDYFEILEFVVENIGEVAPIHKALGFDQADLVAVYGPKIRRSLGSGFSYIVVDKRTDEIVGCALGSVWHRNPRRRDHQLPIVVPKTAKGKLHYELENSLRSRFWDLCPRAVNKIAYGECMLVRKDLSEKHFVERLMKYLNDESLLEDAGVQGSCGVEMDLANLRIVERFGAISLAEMDLEMFFKSNGIPFSGALTDGMTKAVLHYKPFDCDRDFRTRNKSVSYPGSAKL